MTLSLNVDEGTKWYLILSVFDFLFALHLFIFFDKNIFIFINIIILIMISILGCIVSPPSPNNANPKIILIFLILSFYPICLNIIYLISIVSTKDIGIVILIKFFFYFIGIFIQIYSYYTAIVYFNEDKSSENDVKNNENSIYYRFV